MVFISVIISFSVRMRDVMFVESVKEKFLTKELSPELFGPGLTILTTLKQLLYEAFT